MTKVFVAIGYFDGVHIGHKELLSSVKKLADKTNDLCGVFTFGDDFYESLGIDNDGLIDLQERKKEKILAEGLNFVDFGSPASDFINLTGSQFEQFLINKYNLIGIGIGEDFRYGKNAEKDYLDMISFCDKNNLKCHIEPLHNINGEKISSTLIRKLILEGDIQKANYYLGSCFSLNGVVITGRGEARKHGFKTANITLNPLQLKPKEGVYKTITSVDGLNYGSLTHIGPCPTFKYSLSTIETILVDFEKQIYGKNINISFVKRIRDNQQFDNPIALKKQIDNDLIEVRND
jgi:riboflavin kinase / FMN adenylyltransferase